MDARVSPPLKLILQPTRAEAEALAGTCLAYGRACRYVFDVGRAAGTTGNARLHSLCYFEVRRGFALNANLAVRAIARAASMLKQPEAPDFPTGLVDYDPRILSIDPANRSISIATVRGRLRPLSVLVDRAHWSNGSQFSRALLEKTGNDFSLLVHPPTIRSEGRR